DVHVRPRATGQRGRGDERRAALTEGDDGRRVGDVEAIGVLAQHTLPLLGQTGLLQFVAPSTRSTETIDWTASLSATAATVAARADSRASCVPITRVAAAAGRGGAPAGGSVSTIVFCCMVSIETPPSA